MICHPVSDFSQFTFEVRYVKSIMVFHNGLIKIIQFFLMAAKLYLNLKMKKFCR